jgi:hypothetical protein
VTLDPKDESIARLLKPLNQDPAWRVGVGGGDEFRGESLWRHRLVVIAIHREWRALITEDRGESGCRLHVQWMRERRRCRIRRTNLSVDMLQQAPTAMHIQELHAAADAKDW